MEARCTCGQVSFTTPLEEPLALYICRCADCQRQSTVAFGASAIYPRFEIPTLKMLSVYQRPTASGESLLCYFCKSCGVRMIHVTPSKNVASIKANCIIGLDWSKAIHITAKSAMIPIPESSEVAERTGKDCENTSGNNSTAERSLRQTLPSSSRSQSELPTVCGGTRELTEMPLTTQEYIDAMGISEECQGTGSCSGLDHTLEGIEEESV